MHSRIILVTGGAGHVGSHVAEMLAADPANRVISLDNYFNGSEANHVAGVEYRRGSTRDIAKLVPEAPAIVFHLGEYSRIKASLQEPRLVHEMNIAGTFEVVEFCRMREVGKLVYAASSTKFSTDGDGRNADPYAYSKAMNVDLINNYGKWYGLPYAICYFYNGYGPRERGDGRYATLIAKYERLYLKGEPLPVDRPGTQRRAFTYVKDLARGIIMVGEKGSGDGYALGSSKSYSVVEIAEAFGGPISYTDEYSGRTGASHDSSRADELGWKTTVDVMDYIAEFVRTHPRGSAS
jgi:UDP-glucose 4-epimerase